MFEHWRNFGGGMKHLTSAARQTKIRAQFAAPEGVSIPVLAREFGVSEMTIRRDLAALESRAQIRRTHGGAVLTKRMILEFDYRDRRERNRAAKRAIAAEARKLVRHHDTRTRGAAEGRAGSDRHHPQSGRGV